MQGTVWTGGGVGARKRGVLSSKERNEKIIYVTLSAVARPPGKCFIRPVNLTHDVAYLCVSECVCVFVCVRIS